MKQTNKIKKIYDLVDFDDQVVKKGTKEDARIEKLFMRSVHILLVNPEGKIMLCKRPHTSRRYRDQVTSSAGGHVEQGENYKLAAKRELKEELELEIPIKDLGRFDVLTKKERAIHHLFIGKFNDKISVDLNEISSYSFLSPVKIKNDIFLHPRKYTKPFHKAFEHYLEYM